MYLLNYLIAEDEAKVKFLLTKETGSNYFLVFPSFVECVFRMAVKSRPQDTSQILRPLSFTLSSYMKAFSKLEFGNMEGYILAEQLDDNEVNLIMEHYIHVLRELYDKVKLNEWKSPYYNAFGTITFNGKD